MADLECEAIRGISVEEYAAALAHEGVSVVPGAGRTLWRRGEAFSLEREPIGCLDEPTAAEIGAALWTTRAFVASYVRHPDDSHPQNAWLYVCRNRGYSLDTLESRARRDIRHALRSLRFGFIDMPTFLEHGAVAFCSSRSRQGLSDGTPGEFQSCYGKLARNPAHHVLGAWKDDHLAAFLSAEVVEDCASIAVYAASDYLKCNPNDGLIYHALNVLLVREKVRCVTYGLSSIQEESKADSLHRFKRKVGFEALPVHRAFAFHPLLKPLANGSTLWGLRACTRLWPSSRVLRKATGLLATYLGKRPTCAESQQVEKEEEA
jgi:hypothetical protein